MDQERLAMLALRLVPGIGDRLFKELIETAGSAAEIFKFPVSKLLRIRGIGALTAASIKHSSTFSQAEEQFRMAEKNQTGIYFFNEPSFPVRLKEAADAPALLFVKGNINLNQKRIVAIVGTRKATSYGRGLTHELIKDLKTYEPLIVSGLAYGIDIQAHTSCLQLGIPTIGVLGSGIDRIYPQSHAGVAVKMISNGGLVTEEPFGSGPDAHHFPARNRIIAGISDALVVVEAGEKGGALITADIMNSYNRDVFALPGSIYSPWSAGCHRLIKNHQAQLITGAADLAGMLNWDVNMGIASGNNAGTLSTGSSDSHPDPVSAAILSYLSKQKPVNLDDLQYLTGLRTNELSSKMVLLEIEGRINALPGKLFQLAVN
jgi:DNA processing protein